MNVIDNFPISIEAVNSYKKIFGLDLSSLKVKRKRDKPDPAHRDDIKIEK